MANKKCNYCNKTMNRVVWGMPTDEEMENPKPMTEYAGCIIGPLTPKWHCEVCNSEVIPDLNPKSGICLREAPEEVRKGLNLVVGRLQEFAGNDDDAGEMIRIICPGLDPDSYPERDLENHKLHGDFLRIMICGCQNFDVFLDGFAISTQVEFESLYHGGHLERHERETHFTLESLQNLSRKLPDLYFGSTILGDLVDLIGESVVATCKKDFMCEDSENWQMIADHWVYQEALFPDFWLDRHRLGGKRFL